MLIGKDIRVSEIRYKNNKPVAASKMEIMRHLLKNVPINVELTDKNFHWFSLVAEIFSQCPQFEKAKLLGFEKISRMEKFSSNCFSFRYRENDNIRARPIAIKILCAPPR